MSNTASPREPLSRRKTSIDSFALLLCAAGTVLTLAHDASAIAGAPALLPNLNFVNLSPLSTPSGQAAFNPMLVNLTQVLNQPNLKGESFDSSHRWAQAPVTKAIKPHSFAPTQGDLNHFVQSRGLISYPTLPTPTNDDGTPLWNGQGGLPNAMQAPWHYSATNFDPTFRTPYWNEKDGFTNDSFELGLANTSLGQSIFNRGLAYSGKPDLSGSLPVWGGDASDVTRALFPSSNSSRASVAL